MPSPWNPQLVNCILHACTICIPTACSTAIKAHTYILQGEVCMHCNTGYNRQQHNSSSTINQFMQLWLCMRNWSDATTTLCQRLPLCSNTQTSIPHHMISFGGWSLLLNACQISGTKVSTKPYHCPNEGQLSEAVHGPTPYRLQLTYYIDWYTICVPWTARLLIVNACQRLSACSEFSRVWYFFLYQSTHSPCVTKG